MLRTERPGDMLPVYELLSAAFGRSDEAELVNRLRECGAAVVTMVEEEEYEFMGHLMLSPITINGMEGPWLGLAPVAVHPDWQGQGIGSDLIREGLDTALEMDWKGVVVLGIRPITAVSVSARPASLACTASMRCLPTALWQWSCRSAVLRVCRVRCSITRCLMNFPTSCRMRRQKSPIYSETSQRQAITKKPSSRAFSSCIGPCRAYSSKLAQAMISSWVPLRLSSPTMSPICWASGLCWNCM